jgi:iron complex outermembrane recepter protein
MFNRNLWLCACSIAALGAASHALAADVAPAAAVEEVIVTAQKRAENIQDVPLSIMAMTGDQLAKQGVTDVAGLERVIPNLRLDNIAQSAGLTVRIRGFGASSNAAIDPSVAPYIDGAYIPRPGAMLTSFLDVANVEVLRGPQGTLFGRNATVGAISLKTNDPSLTSRSGEMEADLGNYGFRKLEAIGNLPVNDVFALRAAAFGSHTDGYVKNRLDGKTYGRSDTFAGRLSGKWEITPDVTWVGRVDYAKTTGDGINLSQVDTSTATAAQLANFTARTGGNPSTLAYPPTFKANERFDNPSLNDSQWGVSSDLTWNVKGGYSLRLLDSYRDWSNKQTDGDVVFTPLDLLNRYGSYDSKSQSHELQFISPQGQLAGGHLDFVSGLYYFSEDYDIGEVFDLGSQYCSFAVAAAAPPLVGACNAGPKLGAANGLFSQKASSVAAYAQATIKLTSTLDMILGARETHDEKTGNFTEVLTNPTAVLVRAPENTSLKFTDSRPSYRANLSWHATDQIMAFATYSTGYKSGGLNSAGGAAALGAKRLFGSETSTDIELGVKSVFFDRRLLLNVTLYQTDLDNFQDRSFDGTSFIVRNAGSVRAQGVEAEGQARPTEHVKLDFGVAYLNSYFTDNRNAPGLPACNGSPTSCPLTQDLTGRPTTFAPKWQGNIGAEYDTGPFENGFTAQFRTDLSYVSSLFSTNDDNPQSIIRPQTLLGARIDLLTPDKSWKFTLFGENLTDERSFRLKFPQTLDSLFGVRIPTTGATLLRGYMAAPRLYGVKVTKTF